MSSRRRDVEEDRRRYRAAKADELRTAGEPELADEVLAGRCGCGCKARILTGDVRTFYVDERHRKAHHRARVERLAAAAGVPARFSIETLGANNRSGIRPADAQTPPKRRQRPPRTGVSVYFPTPDALEAALNALARDLSRREGAGVAPAFRELDGQAVDVMRYALERRRRKT